MKILWMINTILPQIAETQGMECVSGGGWLVQLANRLGSQEGIELTVVYPTYDDKVCYGKTDLFVYYGVPEKRIPECKFNKKREKQYRNIIAETTPDIVHIWGSEYVHSYTMARAFGKPDRTILSVQGLISIISEHYSDGLPERVKHSWTLRDLLRFDNIAQQQKHFERRGSYEQKLIAGLRYVIGRTEWDYACTKMVNQNISYFKCNEILRTEFYRSKKWSLEKCKRHSLFLTQIYYPVKGFHFLLKALPFILKKYPDTMIYVAGENIIDAPKLKAKVKTGSYARYLRKTIDEQNLSAHITFLGNLNAEQIVTQMLMSHVFVLPSTIENSSNSLSEAMLLGLPCVASNVGGTGSLLTHHKEGLLYQCSDSYMLAYSIMRLFADDELCRKISDAATMRASADHDETMSTLSYLDVYNAVLTGGK